MSDSNDNLIYLPELRRDVQLIPIKDNGRELLYFHDTLGYALPDFALHNAAGPLLALFNGRVRISDLLHQPGSELNEEELESFIDLLDQAFLLKTSSYEQRVHEIEVDFERQSIREPSLSGFSYPADPGRLKKYLDQQFTQFNPDKASGSAIHALFAPHIDMRVGIREYVESFSRLRELRPKKVLILATSHYAGYYGSFYEGTPFIGSSKSYKVPGRIFKTDTGILNQLNQNSEINGFTLCDRAHRVEHSIETHLIYLSAIWGHEFEIIPILVGGLDELFYLPSGDMGKKTDQFASELSSLFNSEEGLFTLISGDLSHVGKKFGDAVSAKMMKENVTIRDRSFIDSATNGSPEKMLSLLSEDVDSTRICGFPPLYVYLKAARCKHGELINYRWWDETERESAVSYGSILY